MNSRHPDPRRVWKGGPQQRVMTPLPGIPGIAPDCPGLAGACSKKLVLEQHSFTFADFCCPRPSPLGLLPVPVLSSEKQVLEQPSFTFADFCCPRPPSPLGLLPVPVLSSENSEASFPAIRVYFILDSVRH